MRTAFVALFPLLALGCAAARPAPAPFFCQTARPTPAPLPAPKRLVKGPVGKLDLVVLEPRLPKPPLAEVAMDEKGENCEQDKGVWYRKQKLRIVADSVPLQAIALALSSALELNVELDPALAQVRVFAYFPETILEDFLKTLERHYAIHVSHRWSGVSLVRREVWAEERRAGIDGEPLRVRLLRLTGKVTAEQFAAIFCRDFATERGRPLSRTS